MPEWKARPLLLLLPLLLACATAAFAQESELQRSVDGDGEDSEEQPLASLFEGMQSSSPDLDRLADQVESLRLRGEYAKSAELAREGVQRSKQEAPEVEARFLLLLGRVQWSLDNFAEAIAILLEGLSLAEQRSDEKLLPLFHSSLGLAYLDSRQFEAALRHNLTAVEMAERDGHPERLSLSLNQLGNYHLSQRDYEQARQMHERSLAIREQAGLTIGIADSLTNLGSIALYTGDPARALEHYQRALEVYQKTGLKRHTANGHRRLAAAYRRLGRSEEAIRHLRLGLEIAEPLGSQAVLSAIYSELARAHEGRGELRSALSNLRRYASSREALLDERTRQRVAELNARYEASRREFEIEALKREQTIVADSLARERSQKIAVAALLVLSLVGAVVILFLQRARLESERHARVVTESARAEAEQAVRLKSRLLQIAAHDLKAPLAAVSATARRIETAGTPPSQISHFARLIRTDAARMASLVREFLDSAAIEAGRIQLHRSEVDIQKLAAEAVEDFQPLAESKRQDLRLLTPDSPPPAALADPERLRQVLDNLITNALKFSPPSGTVAISVGASGRWSQIEVADSGPGLSPADLGKMFQPFQPLSATPTAQESSTGLGLFITRELISMQDGMLEVESQPGKGALFRVLLPAAGRQEPAETESDHDPADLEEGKA